MRTVQVLGLLLTLFGVGFGYFALSATEGESGSAALILIPSSIMLLRASCREKFYFTGRFWLTILTLNSLISICYAAGLWSILL